LSDKKKQEEKLTRKNAKKGREEKEAKKKRGEDHNAGNSFRSYVEQALNFCLIRQE
jgi:hypothetical protein